MGVLEALRKSAEWRIIASVITFVYFLVTTGELWHATVHALVLQGILTAVQVPWFILRGSKHENTKHNHT